MNEIVRPDQWWARYQADPQGMSAMLGCGAGAPQVQVCRCGMAMMCGQQLGDMLGVPVANVSQAEALMWAARSSTSMSRVWAAAMLIGVDAQWLRSRVEWLRADHGGVLESHVAAMQSSGVNVLVASMTDRDMVVDAVRARDWTRVSAVTGVSVATLVMVSEVTW